MDLTELSAVIVAVPEAEELVGLWRAQLDRAAGWGVPAHVTVLFPFVAPAAIDAATLAGLATAIAAVPIFDATFGRIEWFGEDAVWLAPEPSGPFRVLTAAVRDRFRLQPYGGRYGPDILAHLTVGHDAPVEHLRAAAAAVELALPVHAAVRSARLIAGRRAAGSWSTLAEFPLGR